MTITQILNELPAFSFEERQLLIRRALELDDLPLSEADEKVIDARLAAHHADPESSIPLEDLKTSLRRS